MSDINWKILAVIVTILVGLVIWLVNYVFVLFMTKKQIEEMHREVMWGIRIMNKTLEYWRNMSKIGQEYVRKMLNETMGNTTSTWSKLPGVVHGWNITESWSNMTIG